MKVSRLFLLAAIFLLGAVSGLFAQATGDFQSFQNGDWNDVNSWERFDGAIWVNPAPNYPTTADGVVTILSGDTITVTATDSVDQLTVAAGGVLIVSAGDTLNIEDGAGLFDLTVDGIVINAGVLTFDAVANAFGVGTGGLYRHDQNGGTIPTAKWAVGSTCEVTGATSSAPGNANQNFHHFTWNCPAQSSNLNLAWSGNTIAGNLTVVNSASSQFRMTNSSAYADTITIAGDVSLAAGTLTTTGSSGAQTYVVDILGNVTATGGTLAPSRGSGGFATWRLHGDLTVTNTELRSSNNQSRFVFAKTDTQTVTYTGATYNGTFHYEVDESSTVIIADGADIVDVAIHDSLICRGEVAAVGVLTFENGGVYVHARNGGSAPTATWATGSTCEITGVTSSAPSNLSQDFDNFTWNCTGQSSNVDWGWANNTINGTLRVLSSGSARARMTSPSATPLGPNTITIVGDIITTGANFESNGSGSADTIIVESQGNISATGGIFAVSRGSGPMVMWNVYGDFTFDNAESRNSGGTKAAYYFKKVGTQNLNLINPTFGGGGMPIVVESGSIFNMGSSALAGSGIFTLSAGAELQTALAAGLDSVLMNTGTITLSKQASFTFNGSTPQLTGMLMPDSVNVLTFDNPLGVRVQDTVTCADLQSTVVTQLSILDTGSVTADAGNVFGTVLNQGELVGSASLVFESGSTYQHDRNGGNLPTATWTGSHCYITGVTGSAPGNASQNFHHFTWDCAGQSSNLDWGWYNNTISGNVSVWSSGSARARMTSPGASPAGPNVITLLGDLTVTNANFESNGSSSADTITVETYGNISASNGIFAVSRGSGPMVMWNVYGNFTLDNAETRNSGGALASYYFKKNGTQTLTMINPTFGGGGFPAVVVGGTTLHLDSSVVAGSGNFTVEDGATIATTLAGGLDAALTTLGTVSLSKAGSYKFNGATSQSTGALLPDSVSQLMIANAAGVSLSSAVVVSDTLHLTAGKLTITPSDIKAGEIVGGSSSSYVIADAGGSLVRTVGSSEAAFPVGVTSSYAPVWITNAGTVDDFSVAVEPNAGSATSRVNLMWNISELTLGGADATLKLGWMASEETAEFSSNRAADALIFDFADTTEAGSGTYTRQLSTEPYTVSRAGFTSFGTFAVGDFIGTATSVEGEEALPTVFALSQNYPNPFNPTTIIKYDIPNATHVSIKVYDALGRVVSDLVNEEQNPGFYTAQWNATGFASGVYYYRIVAGDFVAVKKMLLVR